MLFFWQRYRFGCRLADARSASGRFCTADRQAVRLVEPLLLGDRHAAGRRDCYDMTRRSLEEFIAAILVAQFSVATCGLRCAAGACAMPACGLFVLANS